YERCRPCRTWGLVISLSVGCASLHLRLIKCHSCGIFVPSPLRAFALSCFRAFAPSRLVLSCLFPASSHH
ncbi:MAG: hypothetical protein FWF09_05255, partial [Bacteroidales bacterium]|nr:hypothetical protein [Bacteroidales bacterium]